MGDRYGGRDRSRDGHIERCIDGHPIVSLSLSPSFSFSLVEANVEIEVENLEIYMKVEISIDDPYIVILSLFLYLVLTVCMLVPLQCSSHPTSFTWRWIERAVEIGIGTQTRIDAHSIDTLYLYA